MPKVTADDRARGKRYKDAREAVRPPLTQGDVAKRMGKSVSAISRLEQGKTKRIDPNESEAYARLYKSNAAWLDYGRGSPDTGEPPYSEWPEFATKVESESSADGWQIAWLRGMRLPAGIRPGPDTYDRLLFGLRSVRVDPADPPAKRGKTP